MEREPNRGYILLKGELKIATSGGGQVLFTPNKVNFQLVISSREREQKIVHSSPLEIFLLLREAHGGTFATSIIRLLTINILVRVQRISCTVPSCFVLIPKESMDKLREVAILFCVMINTIDFLDRNSKYTDMKNGKRTFY